MVAPPKTQTTSANLDQMSNFNNPNMPSIGPMTKYTHTNQTNFQDWKRCIDAALSTHRYTLLSVVKRKKLTLSIKSQLESHHKGLTKKFDDETEQEYIREYNNMAYHIILPTIGDSIFRKEMERKHGSKEDAHGIYKAICSEWTVDNDTSDERIIAKEKQRQHILNAGVKSGSLAHATEFVESILEINNELEDTAFFWKDEVLVTYVLDAIQVHNEPYILAYKGSKTNKKDWRKKFDTVWRELKSGLESNALAKESASHRQSDVLMTDASQSVIQSLTDQVAALTEQVKSMHNNNNSNSTASTLDASLASRNYASTAE